MLSSTRKNFVAESRKVKEKLPRKRVLCCHGKEHRGRIKNTEKNIVTRAEEKLPHKERGGGMEEHCVLTEAHVPHAGIIGERDFISEFWDRISVGVPNHQEGADLGDQPVEHIRAWRSFQIS